MDPPNRAARAWPLVALLIFTVLVFHRLSSAGFLNWDDPITIEHNPRIFPTTLHGLGEIWSQAQGHLYVPVTYTVWWVTAATTGALNLGPAETAHAFHILNIVIHLFSVTAVYWLLRLLIGRPTGAWIGAAIFAMHPVQVETVAWCSGTKDLLAGAMGLWAIYFLLRSRGIVATCLFALALLSKPSAVVFPILTAVLAIYQNRCPHRVPPPGYQGREKRKTIILLSIWLVLCIPIIIIGRLAQSAGASEFRVPWLARPLVAIDTIAFYLQKIFYPLKLAVDYGHSPQNVLTSTRTIWVICTVLLIGGIIYLLRRRLSCLALAAIIFVAALLPILGFVPFDFQDYSTTADHYLYVAMLAPAILAAALSRFRIFTAIQSAIICILALITIHQCRFWTDNVELFSHNLQINPRSGMSHVNLALALADRNQWDLADEHYHAALHLNFAYSRAHFGVGQILAMRGDTKAALAHFEVASHLEPNDPLIHYNLGILLASMNRPDEAIAEYDKSITIEPNFAAAQTNLAALLLSHGDLPGAEQHFRAALQIDPNSDLARRGLEEAEQMQK